MSVQYAKWFNVLMVIAVALLIASFFLSGAAASWALGVAVVGLVALLGLAFRERRALYARAEDQEGPLRQD